MSYFLSLQGGKTEKARLLCGIKLKVFIKDFIIVLFNSLRLASLILFVSIAGCASNSVPESSEQTSKTNVDDFAPLLATSIQPAYRLQVELLRLEQMMVQANNEPLQLARLYYERGTVYDSIGLRTLAGLDFSRALKLKPDFADAYNFIGVYLTLDQQFGRAFEEFDSALELSPGLEYAYLNRGMALHYAGKNKLALADMKSFLSFNNKDPYRIIWNYLVQNELNPELALAELTQSYLDYESNDWGWKIVALLVNKIDQKQLLNSLSNGQISNKVLAERLCEMYFYMAKQKLKQDPKWAGYYFKLAISGNVYSFIEHRYALLELDFLNQAAQQE